MAKHHSPRFLSVAEAARHKVHEVSLAEVQARVARGEPMVLIDVREDHEWAKGRIPNAAHLGRGILERDIEALHPDADTEIVLYCGGGYRSALAAESLQRMGYTNVHSLAGGFRGWCEQGYAVLGERAP